LSDALASVLRDCGFVQTPGMIQTDSNQVLQAGCTCRRKVPNWNKGPITVDEAEYRKLQSLDFAPNYQRVHEHSTPVEPGGNPLPDGALEPGVMRWRAMQT
jgi:hypothetical protein